MFYSGVASWNYFYSLTGNNLEKFPKMGGKNLHRVSLKSSPFDKGEIYFKQDEIFFIMQMHNEYFAFALYWVKTTYLLNIHIGIV